MRKALPLTLLLILGALTVAKFWVVEIVTVAGNEMAPAVQRGDRLLIYRFNRAPRRGQLALFAHPRGSRLMVRRAVGLPGERLGVVGEVPRINGKAVARSLVGDVELTEAVDGSAGHRQMRLVKERLPGVAYTVIKDPNRRSKNVKPQLLENAYFFMADHRNHGTDSRTFGPVPAAKIRGVVLYRIGAGPGIIASQAERPSFGTIAP